MDNMKRSLSPLFIRATKVKTMMSCHDIATSQAVKKTDSTALKGLWSTHSSLTLLVRVQNQVNISENNNFLYD